MLEMFTWTKDVEALTTGTDKVDVEPSVAE
jgi:hypothetical protein